MIAAVYFRFGLAVWVVALAAAVGRAEGAEPGLPDRAAGLKPAPFHRVKLGEGKERIVGAEELALSRQEFQGAELAFHAVVSRDWPEGLVPVFAVEQGGRFELRRRPATGRENLSEALFFAAPPADDPEAQLLAGRWQCVGIHADGGKDFFNWDLTLDAGRVAGRFDPETDYRFASITGGTFRTNELELKVEYINNRYTIVGALREGSFSGVWTKLDEEDHGTWTASRKGPKTPVLAPGMKLAALYEWRHEDSQTRRYAIGLEFKDPGWRRAERPLVLVWTHQ